MICAVLWDWAIYQLNGALGHHCLKDGVSPLWWQAITWTNNYVIWIIRSKYKWNRNQNQNRKYFKKKWRLQNVGHFVQVWICWNSQTNWIYLFSGRSLETKFNEAQIKIKIEDIWGKLRWRWRLQNVGLFVQVSMCCSLQTNEINCSSISFQPGP